MKVLRLFLAGLIALTVVVGGVLAAATVVLVGLAGYVAQLFRPRRGPAPAGRPAASSRPPAGRTGDVIDIEATSVPNDPPVR